MEDNKVKAILEFNRIDAVNDAPVHHIKSLEDIRKHVNAENIEGFLEDFALIILSWEINSGVHTDWYWTDDKPKTTDNGR